MEENNVHVMISTILYNHQTQLMYARMLLLHQLVDIRQKRKWKEAEKIIKK